MKTILAILFLSLLSLSQAKASGCGRYDIYREIVQSKPVRTLNDSEYLIEARTPKTVTLKKKSTGETIVLGWEKTELFEGKTQSKGGAFLESFTANDVMFDEGNGCGPVFRCVTGQIKMQISLPQEHELISYSYPVINEISDSWSIRYIMDAPLLPVFGSLALDVPPLKEANGIRKDVLDSQQCGYGYW